MLDLKITRPQTVRIMRSFAATEAIRPVRYFTIHLKLFQNYIYETTAKRTTLIWSSGPWYCSGCIIIVIIISVQKRRFRAHRRIQVSNGLTGETSTEWKGADISPVRTKWIKIACSHHRFPCSSLYWPQFILIAVRKPSLWSRTFRRRQQWGEYKIIRMYTYIHIYIYNI